ncbi:MAG: preprotein translocase subunit SecG [Rhodobacterales bacterium]|nr:MAG: preprotein translocase subunit SecG [Rhodobacterales bacterium]
MENVILAIHLLLALSLIGIVLVQKSEGGGLGIGGGGGGVMSARGAAHALSKLTWFLAIAFLCTSITLTIVGARNAAGVSVVETVPDIEAPIEAPALPDVTDMMPVVPSDTDAPVAPPRAE